MLLRALDLLVLPVFNLSSINHHSLEHVKLAGVAPRIFSVLAFSNMKHRIDEYRLISGSSGVCETTGTALVDTFRVSYLQCS